MWLIYALLGSLSAGLANFISGILSKRLNGQAACYIICVGFLFSWIIYTILSAKK
jgi:uncharacterized membrane protein